jgi:hypothetical protein
MVTLQPFAERTKKQTVDGIRLNNLYIQENKEEEQFFDEK